MSAYRLTAGAALSEGEAAQLLARLAGGEVLALAPVKAGAAWHLAPLASLNAQQLAQLDRRVSLCARLLNGTPPPAALTC